MRILPVPRLARAGDRAVEVIHNPHSQLDGLRESHSLYGMEGSSHARPFAKGFYAELRDRMEERRVCEERIVEKGGGHVFRVGAGALLRIELLDGAQIVNMLSFNSNDPDERFWAHQTCLIDSLFIGRWSRLWGTMARLRPLLTVLDETVAVRASPETPSAKHHPVLGGCDTPAFWRRCGGSPSAMTAWEQFAEAFTSLELSPTLIVDDACLFQKSFVNGSRVERLPSDALRGDTITFFAEIDLMVLLALSSYVDGGRSPEELRGVAPRPVRVEVTEPLGVPLGWPYEDVSYPDLSLYLDSTGVRASEPGRSPRTVTRRHGKAVATSPSRDGQVGLDRQYYEDLIADRDCFDLISEYTVQAPETAYGFSVDAGDVFRIVTVDHAQITDVCILSRDDPTEHYAAGTQLALEGSYVTRLTRIWGTPPQTRPLCTCIGDSVKNIDIRENVRHHVVYSAHCNPHHWMLYAKRHPNTCYDNLRAGMAMLGLGQCFIHDNLNLFQKSGLDPLTGHFLVETSDAERGDYIEFFAETNLFVVMSLCPYGGGEMDPAEWPGTEIPVFPLRVEMYSTGQSSREWPEDV